MKTTARIFSLILAVMTVFAGTSMTAFAGAGSESQVSAIDLKSPIRSEGREKWQGDYAYFGSYDGAPLKYRVLDSESKDYGGNSILLDCNSALTNMPFNSDGKTKEWEKSDVRKWLNGAFYSGAFEEGEKNAIISSVKKSPSATDGEGFKVAGGISSGKWTPLNGDKVFALDAKELTNESYGYKIQSKAWLKDNIGMSGFWTRTYCTYDGESNKYIYGIAVGQGVYYTFINMSKANDEFDRNPMVSPALNVNREKVALTLPATEAKDISAELSKENREEISEWKLVLRDSAHEKFRAQFKSGSNGTLTVDYKDAATGSDEFLAAVVLNKEGHITYYGKIGKAENPAGEVKVKVPSDYNEATGDKLYIFNEKCNGEKRTDYGSSLQQVKHNCAKENLKYVDNGNGTHRQECAECGYVTLASESHTGTVSSCTKKSLCEKCGCELGAEDASKHENLQHVAAKEATKTEEGNIEYYYCDACGKYYRDADAKEEIQQKDTVLEKLSSNDPDDNDNQGDKGNGKGNGNNGKSNGNNGKGGKRGNGKTITKHAPETGDESNILFAGICLSLSLAALIGLRLKIKNK